MKKRFLSSAVAFVVLAALGATTLKAEESTMQFDPAATKIQFTLGDVLHTVHGSFRLKSGSIHFNPATGEAGGKIVVDATSGDSGNKTRDKKMNKDILQSDKYPEITFTPTRVSGNVPAQGSATVQVEGIFNLHGTDHPMNLNVPVQTSPESATATLHFDVPYVKWGLKNPSTFVLRVSDKVNIDITAAGHLVSATTAVSQQQ